MADFKYEIVEHIGTLSESAKGWTKELNKISCFSRFEGWENPAGRPTGVPESPAGRSACPPCYPLSSPESEPATARAPCTFGTKTQIFLVL